MEREAVLEVESLSAGYGSMQIIWDCSLRVVEGETLLLLGSNGSGKTTLLRAIMGFMPPMHGRILFAGREITKLPVHARARLGMTYSSESSIYPAMTVRENLLMSCLRDRAESGKRMEAVFRVFPDLERFRTKRASGLSGGQRKMLSVGRVLMARPRLLVIDEPSSGLSPLFTERIIESLGVLKKMGITMLVSEQNTEFIRLSDRVMVLDHGRVVFTGSEDEAERNEAIHSAYFGTV